MTKDMRSIVEQMESPAKNKNTVSDASAAIFAEYFDRILEEKLALDDSDLLSECFRFSRIYTKESLRMGLLLREEVLRRMST